jgi:hypothetical protein
LRIIAARSYIEQYQRLFSAAISYDKATKSSLTLNFYFVAEECAKRALEIYQFEENTTDSPFALERMLKAKRENNTRSIQMSEHCWF